MPGVLRLASVAGAAPFIDAVEVEVGDHSVAFPFQNVVPRAPLRPAVTVGGQHLWLDRRFDVVQSVRVGGHAHPTAGNAIRLTTDLDLRWASGVGPVVEAGLGLGLHHVVRQRPILEQTTPGNYEARRGLGRPNLVLGAGVAAGFDLGDVSKAPLTILVDYHWWAQTGFLPSLPLGPQGTLSIGLRATLGSGRKA
ncbi:MAG: hypothetical protein AAGA48_31760 [Myxococcota bacterium]